MHVIETRNLTRRFGRTEAVHDVSLQVPAGAVYALVGPNGAGKTTTIRLLMNLLHPHRGRALVLGRDARRLRVEDRQRIGYVAEGQGLPGWMTVRQYLDYWRAFYPRWDAALEGRLGEAFALPGDRLLRTLSRGMAIKTQLISSLAYRPELLVLDEPFSGLDAMTRDDLVRGLLEQAGTGGWTVLVSTHELSDIENVADHIGILREGRLLVSEPLDRLRSRVRRVELVFGDDPPETLVPPAAVTGFERAGRHVRWVDFDFNGEASEHALTARYPGALVQVEPLSLREVFIEYARKAADGRNAS